MDGETAGTGMETETEIETERGTEAERGMLAAAGARLWVRVRAPADFLEASRTGARRRPPGRGRPGPGEGRCDGRLAVRAIRDIAEEFPWYGRRRVGMELQRRGLGVNLKRVRRILREEGLSAIPPGRGHWRRAGSGGMRTGPAYPDLVRGQKIDRPDLVWAADTTRIMLEREEVFLAVVIDAFSRRCLGWSLGRTDHPAHAMRALRKALRARSGRDLAGLIHHSDRGEVYSDGAYTGLLEGRGIRISVGGRGCPGDNARVERFFGTLKGENVRLGGYSTFADALGGIRGFIEDVYNTKRLHSVLGYLPPVEFEMDAAAARRAGRAGGNTL